jgi:hypothetical protein
MNDKPNDPNNWPEIERYMALSAEQRRAEDRAKYKYLPTPGLLESAGYAEEFIGMWQHRPLPAKWPLHEVHFYSQSGTCFIGLAERGGAGFQRSFAQVVESDEQLLQFLREHQWPAPPPPRPIADVEVKTLRRLRDEPEQAFADLHSDSASQLQQAIVEELIQAGYVDELRWERRGLDYGPRGSYRLTDAGRNYLQHYSNHV